MVFNISRDPIHEKNQTPTSSSRPRHPFPEVTYLLIGEGELATRELAAGRRLLACETDAVQQRPRKKKWANHQTDPPFKHEGGDKMENL